MELYLPGLWVHIEELCAVSPIPREDEALVVAEVGVVGHDGGYLGVGRQRVRHAHRVVDVVGEEEDWAVVVDVQDADGDNDRRAEMRPSQVVGDDLKVVPTEHKSK